MPSYGTEGHSGIVTVEEMRRYLNNTHPESPAKTANIALVLAGTQNELEMYLNRPVEPVQVRELVQTDVVGKAYLRVAPIHSIVYVERADPDNPVADLANPYVPPVFERGDTYRSLDLVPSLLGYPITPGGIFLNDANMYYVLDYVGGYFGYTDDAMKLAIMRVAAREIIPQHSNVMNTSTGQVATVQPSDNRMKGWTQDELKKFSRHRRTVMVSAGGGGPQIYSSYWRGGYGGYGYGY